MGSLNLDFLGQIPSFERCLRGAAPTPLALPYPFRTWPSTSIGAGGDKREVTTILYHGRQSRVFVRFSTYAEVEQMTHGTTFPNWYHF